MTSKLDRTGRAALKMALLGSAALIASGCSAELSYQNLSERLDQQQHSVYTVDPYDLGKKQYADGLYGMALKNFRIALVREPKSIDKLNAVAATYDKLGRFDLSERYYARALAVDPKSVLTLNNVGYSFLLQKDYVSARYYLEQAATVAAADAKYNDIVGANLVSLDMAEGRAVAQLPRPVQASTTNVSMETASQLREEIAVNKKDGQIHAIATQDDVAKVAAAGRVPEQAGGKEGAGTPQDEPVLVPAALPGPKVVAAPVAKVEAEALEAPVAKPATKKLVVPDEVVIELSNGNGRRHMAARTRTFLKESGIPVARLTNAQHFGFATSTVFYREGFEDRAREIANLFPMPLEMKLVKKQRADIRVRFGADSLEFDSQRLAASTGA